MRVRFRPSKTILVSSPQAQHAGRERRARFRRGLQFESDVASQGPAEPREVLAVKDLGTAVGHIKHELHPPVTAPVMTHRRNVGSVLIAARGQVWPGSNRTAPIQHVGHPGDGPQLVRIAQAVSHQGRRVVRAHTRHASQDGLAGRVHVDQTVQVRAVRRRKIIGDLGELILSHPADQIELEHAAKGIRGRPARATAAATTAAATTAAAAAATAAILRAKLKKLNTWNEMRREAAGIYDRLLKDIDGVITPPVSPSVKHVYHVYVIRTKKRQQLLEAFGKKGISAIIHYPIPLHLQQAYKDLGYKKGDFPVAEEVANEIISLPMYPHLNERQIKFIVKTLKGALAD